MRKGREQVFREIRKKVTHVLSNREKQLYICSRCGGKFLLTGIPESCPECGRKYADKVTDLDTGAVSGGELLLRRATRTERAVYAATKNAAKKRKTENPLRQLIGGKGNTVVVIMEKPDEFGE